MSEILTINHPRFENFYQRLLKKLGSTSRIPKYSYFYKDRDGNLYLGVNLKKEYERTIREILQGIGGFDVERTITSFRIPRISAIVMISRSHRTSSDRKR